MSFQCIKCGICCRRLERIYLFSDLDRGDGTCKYLNEITNLCTIYEKRPLKCNVDLMYREQFYLQMSREEYYKKNYVACRMLQGKYKEE
jgi:hypothetical protein